MKAHVWVMPKRTVLDPQGQTIQHALSGLGYGAVTDVRQGKFFVLNLDQRRHRNAPLKNDGTGCEKQPFVWMFFHKINRKSRPDFCHPINQSRAALVAKVRGSMQTSRPGRLWSYYFQSSKKIKPSRVGYPDCQSASVVP